MRSVCTARLYTLVIAGEVPSGGRANGYVVFDRRNFARNRVFCVGCICIRLLARDLRFISEGKIECTRAEQGFRERVPLFAAKAYTNRRTRG